MAKCCKRHEHESDVEHRDSKRVRFTHKQTDKRADMELTADTVAKRAKLFDTSSSSSSSHEVAPNLHDSSGEIGDPETRESVMKRSRVDAGMESNATEALPTEAVTKAAELSLRQTPKPRTPTASETSDTTLRFTRATPTPRSSAANDTKHDTY